MNEQDSNNNPKKTCFIFLSYIIIKHTKNIDFKQGIYNIKKRKGMLNIW